MGFPRQEYWSVLPFPSPGELLDPGIEPRSPTLKADSLPAEPQGKPENSGVGSIIIMYNYIIFIFTLDLYHFYLAFYTKALKSVNFLRY